MGPRRENKTAPMPTSHSSRPQACLYCPKRFSLMSNLATHSRIHEGVKPYNCDECDKRFVQRNDKERHRQMHLPERTFKCRYCALQVGVHRLFYKQETSLRRHIRLKHLLELGPGGKHSKKKRFFTCSFCQGVNFSRKGDHSRHERTHTGTKPYECLYCGKAFGQQEAMLAHQRCHLGVKAYKCDYGNGEIGCGRAFLRNGDRVKHSRIHQRK